MARPPKPEMLASSSPTRSKNVTETVNGSHHFTINGYSLAKGMGVGKYIASDMFTVGGYQWAIYFYPDGKNAEDNSMYVSVFIALASEGQDVRALFELTLVDMSGKGKHKVHSHFDRALESGPYTLKYRGSMWCVFSSLFRFERIGFNVTYGSSSDMPPQPKECLLFEDRTPCFKGLGILLL